MASENLFFALSDERMVSPDHPDSNYGQMLPMFDALGLSPDQILNIDAELTLTESAKSYHDKWAAFFAEGGKISLSVLGLGPDGHTASLFSFHDASPQSMWAIPVQRDPGPNRVSVTRDLLGRAERTVLICPGDSKHEIVKRILNDPNSVIAAHALCDCPDVEIWTT
jgi:6-phosphogluconolactonase